MVVDIIIIHHGSDWDSSKTKSSKGKLYTEISVELMLEVVNPSLTIIVQVGSATYDEESVQDGNGGYTHKWKF